MESSSFDGSVLESSKCSKLSMVEKREFVYELSKWPHGASEMLQSWSRQEILQILCAEMGKERKYTGLTKLKIIENLFRVVSEKKSQEKNSVTDLDLQASSEIEQRTSKRQRKADHPTRVLPDAANSVSISITDTGLNSTIYCKNSACKAKTSRGETFCKRCSCCICYQYDDNKDPSLWLICSSEPPFLGRSCGMSCHLECALRDERSGIAKDKDRGLDGRFNCASCGKVNDLLGSWRKQLIIARDTRRVDILCYRVALSKKLLNGTKHYQILHEIVERAVEKLEEDVGPLTGLPVKKARGIVNRLSSGPEVQKHCALAVESLDSMLSNMVFNSSSNNVIKDSTKMSPNFIRFDDVCNSSLTIVFLGGDDPSSGNIVGCSLWHREADDIGYAAKPTCTLFPPNTRFLLSGLIPSTEYLFKVVYFDCVRELGTYEVSHQTCGSLYEPPNRSQSPVTNCSSLSDPSSVEDETNNVPYGNKNKTQEGNGTACCQETLKIVPAKSMNEAINCNGADERGTSGDTTVSVLDEEEPTETANPLASSDTVNLEMKHSLGDQILEETSTGKGSNPRRIQTGMKEYVPFVCTSEADLPTTPCKLDNNNKEGGQGRNGEKLQLSNNKELNTEPGMGEEPQAGSSSKKKRSSKRREEDCTVIGNKDEFEYYVKVIRWLECDGHIEMTFRQKFLTWYSLRATPREVKIVKVFVDTFIEDPASLAGQLVDTFSDVVSGKRSSVVPTGFCLKLWH